MTRREMREMRRCRKVRAFSYAGAFAAVVAAAVVISGDTPWSKVRAEVKAVEVVAAESSTATPVEVEVITLETGASAWKYRSEIPLDESTQEWLYEMSEKYEVPLSIALGVIETESTFRRDAVNPAGTCFGYMQINVVNADWLRDEIGIEDITDGYQNIESGLFILSGLHEKYGDWEQALVCYNCGEAGAKRKFFDQGEYSSGYSRKVMESSDKWEVVLVE